MHVMRGDKKQARYQNFTCAADPDAGWWPCPRYAAGGVHIFLRIQTQCPDRSPYVLIRCVVRCSAVQWTGWGWIFGGTQSLERLIWGGSKCKLHTTINSSNIHTVLIGARISFTSPLCLKKSVFFLHNWKVIHTEGVVQETKCAGHLKVGSKRTCIRKKKDECHYFNLSNKNHTFRTNKYSTIFTVPANGQNSKLLVQKNKFGGNDASTSS
jgi:hypothetical protein